MATKPSNPSEVDIFALLSNRRRRQVLEILRTHSKSVTLRKLAEEIAKKETGESSPSRNARRSVYNSLTQTHLPKLDAAEAIDYNKHRKVISHGNHARRVYLYMEVVTPYGITWAQYYQLFALLAFTTVLLLESNILVLPDPAVLLLTSGCLLFLVLSIIYQYWSHRWFYIGYLAD